MLTKSASLPNLIFEVPKSKQYTLKLREPEKTISYGDFLRNNPNASRNERKNMIKLFYDKLFK
jgi:hypothetical protein